MVGVFERVFETGPVFRAEPHDTVRHLAEYVSLDAEVGFITDHRDVLSVLREVVTGMVAEIRRTAAEDTKEPEWNNKSTEFGVAAGRRAGQCL